jgi:hypothetical protein
MKHSRLTLLAMTALLSACGGQSVKDTLGLSRKAPDEFRVVSRPPLSVPPQFSLRPPSATDASPTNLPADKQAQSMMTGAAPDAQSNTFVLSPAAPAASAKPGESGSKSSSPEEQFLRKAGANASDPNVRNTLIEEKITKQEQEEEKSWWNVMSSNPEKKDPMVDAKKEADRIQQNEDEGKPVTEGDTPQVKGRDTGVLGRIFGY